MMKLLLALDAGEYWEASEAYRPEMIRKQNPKGVPENYIELEGQGAQINITALRLDGSTLAVAAGSPVMRAFSDGAHPMGYYLRVLRRTPEGWQDLTEAVFPYSTPPHGSVSLYPDNTLVSRDESRKHSKIYRFNGQRFVRVSKSGT